MITILHTYTHTHTHARTHAHVCAHTQMHIIMLYRWICYFCGSNYVNNKTNGFVYIHIITYNMILDYHIKTIKINTASYHKSIIGYNIY